MSSDDDGYHVGAGVLAHRRQACRDGETALRYCSVSWMARAPPARKFCSMLWQTDDRCSPLGYARGKFAMNVVPCFAEEVTLIAPPCAVTISFVM